MMQITIVSSKLWQGNVKFYFVRYLPAWHLTKGIIPLTTWSRRIKIKYYFNPSPHLPCDTLRRACALGIQLYFRRVNRVTHFYFVAMNFALSCLYLRVTLQKHYQVFWDFHVDIVSPVCIRITTSSSRARRLKSGITLSNFRKANMAAV